MPEGITQLLSCYMCIHYMHELSASFKPVVFSLLLAPVYYLSTFPPFHASTFPILLGRS